MERAEDRHIDFRIFRDVDSCETHYPAGAEILGPGKISGVMYVVKKGTAAIEIKALQSSRFPMAVFSAKWEL